MEAKSIFVGMFIVILMMNIFYISTTPDRLFVMGYGVLIGFALSIIPILVLGASIAGSYILSEQAQKTIISLVIFINLMFSIEIYGVNIGLGLMNNVYLALGGETFLSIGFMLTTMITVITLISGLLMVIENA